MYKRGGKLATGTIMLGFWFGLGDSDNPSLNLKSRKENRRKILSCFPFMRLDGVRMQRIHLGNRKTLGWQRPFTKGTIAALLLELSSLMKKFPYGEHTLRNP